MLKPRFLPLKSARANQPFPAAYKGRVSSDDTILHRAPIFVVAQPHSALGIVTAQQHRMSTRKIIKPRRPRRHEAPRYIFRITPDHHERLQLMGTVERRKFVKFVRERFTLDLDEWDKITGAVQTAS